MGVCFWGTEYTVSTGHRSTRFRMFAVFVLVASFGWAAGAPAAGTCMCVTGSSVHIRSGSSLHSSVYGSVSQGECYLSGGHSHTADGYTWYDLRHVHGHSTVWIASNYVHSSAHSACTGGSTGGSGSGGFATGIVSQACLQCLCVQESGCKAIGCHFDVNSDSCGYFQIKQGYWTDCGSPGTSWHACANDKHCASQCVQNYMKRYASHYHCPMTCEGFAREHNGGPQGCHHSSTVSYWHGVTSHAGCHGVH